MPLGSGETIDSQVVMHRVAYLRRELLIPGGAYRVLLREFNGKEFTRRIAEASFVYAPGSEIVLSDAPGRVAQFLQVFRHGSESKADGGHFLLSDDTRLLREALARGLFSIIPEEWERPQSIDSSH
jgi:hypothetical protein